MSKSTWLYASHTLLFVMEVVLLVVGVMMFMDPIFKLIPIPRYNPYIVSYFTVNLIQAILCICVVIGLYRSYINIVTYSHYVICFTILIDAIMMFIFSAIMSNAHLRMQEHIIEIYTDPNIFHCSIWDDVYEKLHCCPPAQVIRICQDAFNITRTDCPIDHSNDCSVHLRKWLHSNTEWLGICAFCVIVPLKLFMCCALRKDIEEVEAEIEEQAYFGQMITEYNRHGDGYIDSYKSENNLTRIVKEVKQINAARETRNARTSSQYSPFLKQEVIEEVENEFTVRGDELREQLQHAMAAHSLSEH